MESRMPVTPPPWRLLLLDRSDPQDPKWLLATITLASDILPASLDSLGRYEGWEDVTQWVRRQFGYAVEFRPVPAALAWNVDKR